MNPLSKQAVVEPLFGYYKTNNQAVNELLPMTALQDGDKSRRIGERIVVEIERASKWEHSSGRVYG